MSINVNGSVGISQNTTEVTKIPVGTTAQRPDTPEAGMIRFNTDEEQVEGFDGTEWANLGAQFMEATGGTVTEITQNSIQYRVHTFTSSGTFEVTKGGEVEYLVVAGGGGAGTSQGGGGGAGGYRSSVPREQSGDNTLAEPSLILSSGVYTVTVGDGGAGGVSGQDSIFSTITSIGGGRGANRDGNPSEIGGSGGGGSLNRSGASGTANQGNSGGNATGTATGFATGGGGGASTRGADGSGSGGGVGGDGIFSSIDGSSVARAGGGSGEGYGSVPTGGGASIGGGGDVDQPGAPNTGGGGGSNGSAGGSGIVIVRYRIG